MLFSELIEKAREAGARDNDEVAAVLPGTDVTTDVYREPAIRRVGYTNDDGQVIGRLEIIPSEYAAFED